MRNGWEIQKEVATVKKRRLDIKLSDYDVLRLIKKAGEVNLTVSELLENFIADLVCGTFTNGSDERMFAEEWFNRCRFAMFSENTLLSHLLETEVDLKKFIAAYEENENYKAHPEDYRELMEDEPEDTFWFEDELKWYLEGWTPTREPDMNKEIERIRDYLSEIQMLTSENENKDPEFDLEM